MKNISLFKTKKQKKDKITMLTVYDYSTAALMDRAGIDAVLVGDSLGMVMLGYPNTRSVTMQDMTRHTQAVARGVKNAFIIADLPVNAYKTAFSAAKNSRALIKAGAEAVKFEGGEEVSAQIKAVVKTGIPVMAHIGLTPQAVKSAKDFKVQGKTEESARKIFNDALAVEKAGAFAVVLECVPARLAALITQTLNIPVIGIGAGKYCDGQVLVYQDMLGIYGSVMPRFVKRFADAGKVMETAFKKYIKQTRNGTFPSAKQSYSIDENIIKNLKNRPGK